MTSTKPARALLVVCAVGALSACQAEGATDEAGNAPRPTHPSGEASKAARPSYPGAKDEDKAVAPGQPVNLSGWSTTAAVLKRTPDGFGNRNLCTTVTMVNRDDEQQEYSPLSWKLQVPGGNVQDMTFTGDDKELGSNGLAPGGRVQALVCFDDKKAGAGLYILSWQPDVFSGEERGVWLNRL